MPSYSGNKKAASLKLTPGEAGKAERFSTKGEAEAAAREYRVPIDCVREAEMPGGFRVHVIIGEDGRAMTRDGLKAASAEPDPPSDTLSDTGPLPASRTFCGTCWMRSARNHLDIAGRCGVCGSNFGPGRVRPKWAGPNTETARRAAEALAAKYRCTYAVFEGDDPEPYKVAPIERVPPGALVICKAAPPKGTR